MKPDLIRITVDVKLKFEVSMAKVVTLFGQYYRLAKKGVASCFVGVVMMTGSVQTEEVPELRYAVSGDHVYHLYLEAT